MASKDETTTKKRKAPELMMTVSNEYDEEASLHLDNLPSCGRIVSFLPLQDMLHCRLVSATLATRIHEQVLPEDCVAWLGQMLRERNLLQIPVGGIDSMWVEATDNRDEEKTNELMFLFRGSSSTNHVTKGASPAPLDCLLRCCRVAKFIPKSAAVAFSGKFGRFLLPLSYENNDASATPYDPCHRGKKNCATCRFKIPRKPIIQSSQEVQSEDEDDESEHHFELSDYFQIAVNDSERLDLEQYFCTCVPNIPNDLVCPLCHVTDRRTLLLTEIAYETTDETARNLEILTFTPNLDANMSSTTFPPSSDIWLCPPGLLDWRDVDRRSIKHGMAISCNACRSFGLIAPAAVCGSGFRTFRQVKISDRPFGGTTLLGCLSRTPCAIRNCPNGARCVMCREGTSGQGPPYCRSCHDNIQILSWHA